MIEKNIVLDFSTKFKEFQNLITSIEEKADELFDIISLLEEKDLVKDIKISRSMISELKEHVSWSSTTKAMTEFQQRAERIQVEEIEEIKTKIIEIETRRQLYKDQLRNSNNELREVQKRCNHITYREESNSGDVVDEICVVCRKVVKEIYDGYYT